MPRSKKILLFEWLTSGGLWRDSLTPAGDCLMQKQGHSMLMALAEDFLSGGLEVVLPIDGRLANGITDRAKLNKIEVGETDDLQHVLVELASQSDYVMVIAPETGGTLSNCLQWLKDFDDQTINPNCGFTELASNKQLTFEHLESNGFKQFPAGVNFKKFLNDVHGMEFFPLPAVLKPNDGAGSEEVFLVDDWKAWRSNLSRPAECYRLESFVDGTSVSVSAIGTSDGYDLLTPTIQLFDTNRPGDGLIGEYVGAEYPIDETISKRAVSLASRVLQSLPPTRGYLGMDLVIGDRDSQPNDCLIEINPRLTSSYLRLREIYNENLAMLNLNQAIESKGELATNVIKRCTFRAPCP